MANPKTPGDLFFESYCDLNGYLHWHEPDSGRLGAAAPTRPDYLIERGGDRALAEVKHFTTTRVTDRLRETPGRAVWWTKAEAVGTIQSAIRDAAERQLAPFAGVGIPLVAVLTNPREADVSFDREDVISAVLGPVEHPVDPHTLELMQPTYGASRCARQAQHHACCRRKAIRDASTIRSSLDAPGSIRHCGVLHSSRARATPGTAACASMQQCGV